MRSEHLTFDDFQIPAEHLCDGCGYEPVFSSQAKCEVCVKIEAFAKFASEINDVFGTVDVLSRVVNDALIEVESEIYDNPGLDMEVEKRRIRERVAKRIQGVLSELGLDS